MIGNSQENAAPSTGHKILREGKGREVGRHGKIRTQYLFPITFLDVECQKISNNQAFIHVPQSASKSQKEVLALLFSIFLPRTARGKGEVEDKRNHLIVEKPQTEGSCLCMDP